MKGVQGQGLSLFTTKGGGIVRMCGVRHMGVPPGSLFVSCLRFLFLVRLVFAREDQSGYSCMCNCLSRRANS